jgi:hypothetical protein
MATRTQVGNVPLIDGEGQEYHVYIERWADEEPNLVLVDGPATYLMFDPSAPGGRQRIRDLRDRLDEALAVHEAHVRELYSNLTPGDYCGGIRLPLGDDEPRCSVTLTWWENGRWLYGRCSRPQHDDIYHVSVDDQLVVRAVAQRESSKAINDAVELLRRA